MSILSFLGLMKRAEHERIVANADDAAYNSWIKVANERDFYVSEYKALNAKFKLAATDLAAQADEIAANRQDADRVQHMLDESEKLVSALTDKNVELIGKLQTATGWADHYQEQMEALRPDALLWRAARDKRAARKAP